MVLEPFQVLGSGFEVISIGKRKLVRSVPTELNKDHNAILELAQVMIVFNFSLKTSWCNNLLYKTYCYFFFFSIACLTLVKLLKSMHMLVSDYRTGLSQICSICVIGEITWRDHLERINYKEVDLSFLSYLTTKI